MGICKNLDCNNETKGKNVYCSYQCRNVYVNKHLRDYSKNGEGVSNPFKAKYTPKSCNNPNCENLISYIKRNNQYCCASCATSHSNLNRNKEVYDKISKTHLAKDSCKYIYCKNCNKKLKAKLRKIYCDSECRRMFTQKDMDQYKAYRQNALFKFKLNDYPEEFEFDLIKVHGWYKPVNKGNNLSGVSRDHMLSVREGYDKGIDPKLLAHPANCRLMIHNQNISKNKKSIITEDELNERIYLWNLKYKILSTMKQQDAF